MLSKLLVRLGRLLLVIATLAVVQLSSAQPAMACDPVEPFEMSIEHIVVPELNDPTSQVALDYIEYHYEGASLPDLIGGYETETIYTLEPVDEWVRGSVSVVTKYWGEPPSNMGPFVVDTYDLAEFDWEPRRGFDPDCDSPPNGGPALGTVRVGMVFANSDTRPPSVWGPDAERAQALNQVFGEPTEVPRDLAAEQEAIAGIEADRLAGDEQGRPLAFLIGLGALVLGLGFFAYRSKA